MEETRFELAVPPRRERLWGATPGKHCRLGPKPCKWLHLSCRRLGMAGAGPMVRIRFPPAVSQGELSYCAPGSFRSRTPPSFAKRPYAIDAARRSRLPTISTKLGTSTRDGISYWFLASHVA